MFKNIYIICHSYYTGKIVTYVINNNNKRTKLFINL